MYSHSRRFGSSFVLICSLLFTTAAVSAFAQPSSPIVETRACKGEAEEIAGLFTTQPGIKIAIVRSSDTDADAAKAPAFSEKDLRAHLEKSSTKKSPPRTEVRIAPCLISSEPMADKAKHEWNVDLLVLRLPDGKYKVFAERWTSSPRSATRGLETLRKLPAPSSAAPQHEALRSFFSGVMALREERYQDAVALFSRPELMALEGPSSTVTSSRYLAAAALSVLGKKKEARARLEEPLAACAEADTKCRCFWLEHLAGWQESFDVAADAPETYRQALTGYRKDNDQKGVTRLLRVLALLHEKLGEMDQAKFYFRAYLQAEPSPETASASTSSASPTAPIRGSMDKEIIRRIIRSNINEVKLCYEKELVKNPELQGRLMVQFLIGASGNVGASTAVSSTMNSPAVEDCIVNAVGTWRFPKPQGGGIVVVTYPFLLKSATDDSPHP